MKVPTEWIDRFEVIDGHIYRIIKAYWYEHELDVYMESDDGKFYRRNMYQSCLRGWCVAFPGMKFYERGDPTIAALECWCQLSRAGNFGGGYLTEEDKDIICSLYPSFRYTLKKHKILYKWQCMEVLIKWCEHPQLEYVLAAGYVKVGMSKYFWRLSETKRWECAKFMQKHPECDEFTTQEILSCLKSKNPDICAEYIKEVDKYTRQGYYDYKITLDDYLYLKKLKGIKKDTFQTVMKRKISIYTDVLRMLHNSNHDMNDEYWRHPKDLCAIHARLVEERDREREQRQLAEMEKVKNKLIKIIKKFEDVPQRVNGYSIVVTSDFEEWKRQANALHQCIVASGYYEGMANGSYTIIFIQKKGVPVATAQVYEGGRIGQFYADELDRDNCLPTPEVKKAFEKWLAKVPKDKFAKIKERKRHAA